MTKKEDCIFCKIVSGEVPSYKVYEDEKFLGILDLFPGMRGMTLLIPKEHYDSYIFEMPDDVYVDFLLKAKELGKKIDKVLGVQRTAMVMEGMGVNHAHIKLYPLHGLDEDFAEIVAEERKYSDKYEGYLSTLMGPKAEEEELKELQKLFL
ncbi:MAG: HIT family protein [Ignavibacteriae bacterium]|nr:HIT family protein [Ignavibacteriota bacterium]MCB0724675.1 HIT family protein [Ignavibacteriota bacterium]MCB9242312.1 HIT family protein [Ignavibacteriales bacterium]